LVCDVLRLRKEKLQKKRYKAENVPTEEAGKTKKTPHREDAVLKGE
jgi:hypothetical protein